MGPFFSRSIWSRWFGRRSVAPVSRRVKRVQLRLEILEEREVPAVITINSLLDTTIAGDGQLTLREAIVAVNTGGTGGNNDFTGRISGAFGSSDTINFAPGLIGSVKLTQSQLAISKNVTINGLGAGQDTIDAQLLSRVIDVTVANVNLTLSGLTVTRGKTAGFGGGIVASVGGDNVTLINSTVSGNSATATGGGMTVDNVTLINSTVSGNTTASYGGGVSALGNVTLTNSTVSGNTATTGKGGGVYTNGTFTMTNSTLSGNTASKYGGVYAQGNVTLTNSTVSGNSATSGSGGGVSAYGSVKLTNSTVSGNFATSGKGGGVYARYGNVTLTNSTVSGNTAKTDGGGVDAYGSVTLTNSTVSGNTASRKYGGVAAKGNATITNSTISGNTAGTNYAGLYVSGNATVTNSTISGNTGGGKGGGVYLRGATSTLTNCTIANNIAKSGAGIYIFNGTATVSNCTITGNQALVGGNGGGGIFVQTGATLNLNNTIVANNSDATGNGPDIRNLGTLTAKNSLVRNTTGNGVTAANGNIINTDPQLGPLQNNGGPTQTMAPKAGSAAINAGSNALIPAGTTTDQRGAARISGVRVDIGAFELQIPTTTTLSSSLNPANVGQSVTLTATVNSALFGTVKAGSVTFLDNGRVIATVALNASGQAAIATAALAAGSHTITAVFQPAANDGTGYTTSQATLNQVVNAGATAAQIRFTSVPITSAFRSTFSVSLAAYDANGNFVGTYNQPVTLKIVGGPAGGQLVGNPMGRFVNGVATFNGLSFNMPGTYTLEADTPDGLSAVTLQPIVFTVTGRRRATPGT